MSPVYIKKIYANSHESFTRLIKISISSIQSNISKKKKKTLTPYNVDHWKGMPGMSIVSQSDKSISEKTDRQEECTDGKVESVKKL